MSIGYFPNFTTMKNGVLPLLILILFNACSGSNASQPEKAMAKDSSTYAAPQLTSDTSAAAIIARKDIPVLCYHQIRDLRPTDSKRAQDYIVSPSVFAAQMKLLSDSGFNAILPNQLYDYLKYGKVLPEKSVLIQFDDADLSQFEVAKPILDLYKFKASFFIMTVVLGKKGYMNADQIKQLSNEGHVIGSHTWDHKNVKTYTEEDWITQVDKPSARLKEITGKPVEYFAYPFGLMDHKGAEGLHARGFKAAFQLIGKDDEALPLFSIRRHIIPGYYDMKRFYRIVKG